MKEEKEETTVLTVEIPKSLRKRLKAECLEIDMTIKDFLTELIDEHTR